MNMSPKVDDFIIRATTWQEEIKTLRAILLECQLVEEFKWGKPCYSFQNSNVVNIIPFKNSCALMFFKEALLRDPCGVLIRPTENTQAARQMRFINVQQIIDTENIVRDCVLNAIEVERAGLEVEYSRSANFILPEEFQSKLDDDPSLKAAFEALTTGRQRAYYLHFSAPKQSRTRLSRVEKCIPRILEGKGLMDR